MNTPHIHTHAALPQDDSPILVEVWRGNMVESRHRAIAAVVDAEGHVVKAWGDINQPIYGPTESHFDAWVGYQRKLSDKIDWRVQFNVRSVGEKSKLVTAAVEPDGSVAQQRIMSGATYDFSMKFMF